MSRLNNFYKDSNKQLHKGAVFVMLMDVKIPTLVGILTFMSIKKASNLLLNLVNNLIKQRQMF